MPIAEAEPVHFPKGTGLWIHRSQLVALALVVLLLVILFTVALARCRLREGRQPRCVILSAHTHGGQIRLPGLRPLTTLTRLGTRYSGGLYPWGNGFLYVNRGIGTTMVPLRMYAAPEVACITLRPAATTLENPLN